MIYPNLDWIFFVLISVFGGLTIFLHDDAFLKWKVTIINGVFALALIISAYGFKKNLLKQFLGESLTLPDHIWTRLNNSWALFFLFCGVINIYIAYNFDLDTWINFKVFGLTGLTLVFSVVSIFSLYKYLPKEEKNKDVELSKIKTNDE